MSLYMNGFTSFDARFKAPVLKFCIYRILVVEIWSFYLSFVKCVSYFLCRTQ